MQQTSLVTIPDRPLLLDQEKSISGEKHSSTWLTIAEILLVLALLVISGIAHGVGMLNNPFYLGDEGIYMSQAWAVVKEGRLDPYTYTYGHAPGGWLQIALWVFAVGSFHTFGTAIETGRVLMLIYQLGSTLLVYSIARRISSNMLIATLAVILFSLSPYAIYLHRRVLLDNIMTFWMLLSLFFLLSKRLSLNMIWLSAITLAIAVLSKENALFVLPAFAFLIFHRAAKEQRLFATIGWITLVCSIVSMYVLMAVLKGELFPPGTLLGGNAPHVSLLGSAGWQASRELDAGLFSFHSKFWNMTFTWAKAAPFLVIGGIIAAFLAFLCIFLKKYRLIGGIGLSTFLLWLFLIRGSLVLEFYLVPELPFMALSIALVIWVMIQEIPRVVLLVVISKRLQAAIQRVPGRPRVVAQKISRGLHIVTWKIPGRVQMVIQEISRGLQIVTQKVPGRLWVVTQKISRGSQMVIQKISGRLRWVKIPKGLRGRHLPQRSHLSTILAGTIGTLLILLCLGGLLLEYNSPVIGLQDNHYALWQPAEVTQSQKDSVAWIETHIPRCSSLVIDPYMWTELHDPLDGKSGYTLAHSYWQVELDPAIKNNVFHNDWHNVDYIISTPGMVFDTNYYQLNIVEAAMSHATLIASFSSPHVATWHINVYQVRKGTLSPGIGCKSLS